MRNAGKRLCVFPTIEIPICGEQLCQQNPRHNRRRPARRFKRGETPVSELRGASKSMYESMSEQQLDEFASTKRKGKPEHVAKTK